MNRISELLMAYGGPAFILSLIMCGVLVLTGPKDSPDGQRKMQAAAVPSAGGLGFGLAVLIVLAYMFSSASDTAALPFLSLLAKMFLAVNGLILFVSLALLVGLLDDLGYLATRMKFLLLAVLALSAAGFGHEAGFFFLPGMGDADMSSRQDLIMAGVNIAGSALWIFVLLNAVNFMDGANGVAMGSLLIMLAGVMLLAVPFTPAGYGFLIPALIGALAAFLIWNLPGKLYAGDTGAYFAGMVLATALLALVSGRHVTVWTSATITLPFLIDVLMTLIWRARHGRNWLQAHRDHAYQLFIRAGWRHARVAALWWGLSLISTGVAVWAARTGPDMAFWVFWSLLATACVLWLWQRRAYQPRIAPQEADGKS